MADRSEDSSYTDRQKLRLWDDSHGIADLILFID